MQFGSSGLGSASHVACLLLNSTIGVEVVHVPYRGLSQAMQDLMRAASITCARSSPRRCRTSNPATCARWRCYRPIAATLPELPTADEQGIKGFDIDAWNAFFFPKSTPPEIVQWLADVTSKIMDDPELQKQLVDRGLNIAAKDRRNQAYLKAVVASDLAKWRPPLQAAGLIPE